MNTIIQKNTLIKLMPDVNECIQETYNLDMKSDEDDQDNFDDNYIMEN